MRLEVEGRSGPVKVFGRDSAGTDGYNLFMVFYVHKSRKP